MSATDTLTTDCPTCGQHTLKAHCGSARVCGWAHCTSKSCDATLDFKRRVGHRLVPSTKGTGRVNRIRLIRDEAGDWVARDTDTP